MTEEEEEIGEQMWLPRIFHMQMGPALLPTPLAPVAITGVSLRLTPKGRYGAMSPGARAGTRFRQAADPMQASSLPAWRFRGRAIRGGSMFHLVPFRPKPSRFHPQGAGLPGLSGCVPSHFFHRQAPVRRPAHEACVELRGFRHRIEIFQLSRFLSGCYTILKAIRSSSSDGLKLPLAGESFKPRK